MNTTDAAGLLFLARADARDALVLITARSRNAAYHAQQAAEKLTKALLKWLNVSYPALQHRLDALIELLDDGWRRRLEPFAWLQAYATTYRYADGGRIRAAPDPARLETAVRDLLALIEQASMEVGVLLTEDERRPFVPR